MRTFNSLFTKVMAVSVISASLLSVGFIGTAEARTKYENGGTTTTKTPVFNDFYDVPYGVGDEADFVRVKPAAGTNADYISTLNAACNIGDTFTVRTYVHNGSSPDYNDNGDGSAVAHDVVVKMLADLNQEKNSFGFKSTISASNAASVTDSATLNCGDKVVKLSLVAGTVQTYSKPLGFKTVTDSAVNGSLKIGSRVQGSGDVWGCWDDRVIVTYEVKVEKKKEVVEPKTVVAICEGLVVKPLTGRTVRVSVEDATVENATVLGYRINFGNNVVVNEQTAEYTYDSDGTKTIVGYVNVRYDEGAKKGQTEYITSDDCEKKITFKADEKPEVPEEPETPVTPVTPDDRPPLPATGAAGMLLGVSGASALGALGHRFVTIRRLKK